MQVFGLIGYFLTVTNIPDVLSMWIAQLGMSRYVIISILVFVYIVLGCFMEGLSIMILTIPIIFPMVILLGFDPLWFGVIITLTMEMGLITPPVGINRFYIL